ncbi:hypothetical protein [Kutzneria albida]|uniref:Uncharacterized protein n=1 Tax=Kutzneria albida DSM 43870 TaxID=1449976 RepID=W5WC29_9PSEU|nr:hypothetical protein [Kutzneria albida]AHH98310.1 hypothetical protein KALB_4948 [Kutzneria albida DSM 43870]
MDAIVKSAGGPTEAVVWTAKNLVGLNASDDSYYDMLLTPEQAEALAQALLLKAAEARHATENQ